MNLNRPDAGDAGKPPGLSGSLAKLFARPWFAIVWGVFLLAMVRFVGWPVRNAVLVCWFYGSDVYFNQGIRVIPGKPIKFSNGDPVPGVADFVTGFAAFWITVGGLTLLLAVVVQIFRRKSSH